jgi:tetratricopeptide (TPR) repeat protein
VAYQNYAVKVQVAPFASVEAEQAHYQRLAARYQAPTPAYGFWGRDVDILEIEKRLLRGSEAADQAANILLVQGMGGTGKTTLLQHLMAWWQSTRLVDQVIYFGYDQKAYRLPQILDGVARQVYGEAAFAREFLPFGDAVKAQKLAEKLRAERHLLVLDNLESVTGAALSIKHTLNEAEQAALRDWLVTLAGGRTLVLLGSRGPEEWLVGQFGKLTYELPGLDPEAAGNMAEAILQRHNAAHYRSHPDHRDALRQLLKLLDGYPLALEIVLANLARQTPQAVLDAFSGGAAGIDADSSGELWQDKTASILRCVEYSHSNLSPAAQALLACLAPFTGVINANWLPQYTAQLQKEAALADLPFEQWPDVVQEAVNWGLLTPHEAGGGYLRLQPILPYFLRQRLNEPEAAAQQAAVMAAFRAHYDGIGGALVQLITSKEAQERQVGQALIGLEYENLMTALKSALAARQPFWRYYDALAQYLRSRQAFGDEKAICELILTEQKQYPEEAIQGEIGGDFFMVYGSLGNTNLSLKLYDEAQATLTEALQLIPQLQAIAAELRGQWEATTHHQLGNVAYEQRQWETAVHHYNQALQIKIEFNDRYSQAATHHQLGNVAYEQRQWETAVHHYNQALQIKIEFNDRYSQAGTHHQLGMVAEEQEQWETAIDHYFRAIEVYVQTDEYNLGISSTVNFC